MPAITCPACATPTALPDHWPHPAFTCAVCGSTVPLAVPAPPHTSVSFDHAASDDTASRRRPRDRGSRGGGAFRTMFGGTLGCFAAVVLVCGFVGFLGFNSRRGSDPQQQQASTSRAPDKVVEKRAKAAPEPPAPTVRERWQAFVLSERAARKERLLAAITAAETELANAKGRLRRASTGKQELDEKKAVADATAKLATAKGALTGADTWEPSVELATLRVGDFGKLRIGEDFVPTFKVLQVLNSETALLTHDSQVFWVEMNASGLVDGRTIALPGIVECTGTRQYTTAAGVSNTVFVLRHSSE